VRRLIDQDPRREAARQNRIISAADRRFSRQFAAEIARAMREMSDKYEATGNFPALPDDHERRIRDLFLAVGVTMIEAFGDRILRQGKALKFRIETKEGFAEFFQRLALEWISAEAIRRRITSISEFTRTSIISVIMGGQGEGLGVSEIAKNINRRVPTISRWRGALIARTETHGAANYGANEAAKATGLTLKKEWLAVSDKRTRGAEAGDKYDHLSMDGQIVERDEPFKMPAPGGTIDAMYPGDRSLPAGASINCRCAVSYIVDDGF